MAPGIVAMPSLGLRRRRPADCKFSSVEKMGAQGLGALSSDGARDRITCGQKGGKPRRVMHSGQRMRTRSFTRKMSPPLPFGFKPFFVASLTPTAAPEFVFGRMASTKQWLWVDGLP